ncbi:conserved hypothetical protein [Pediculus humanus corporis]|uniref:N-acetyltransferase domain-containing protein n=1 Tax=Pediculus humanus subsp. corporis TaxID=121224 RepID=E0W1H0_PEDHC|nr:uncharacterized protein Phum_PHUM576980 [Pediculus humanus corporis]EEB19476.1 conserved hypothetical protein [Pediculus humanus corporis]
MSPNLTWERPKNVPIPTTWSKYESNKPMANGIKPKFIIQDFTEEWRDQVIQIVTDFFLRDEPLSKSINFKKNNNDVQAFLKYIHEYLNKKMVLIAIVENLNELGDGNLPLLAGCNITGVITKGEKEGDDDDKNVSEQTRKIFKILEKIEEMNDPYKYYGVNEFLYALGLTVHPAFRGHNLGHEILKARFPLCKATGIKSTVTVFTAIASQIAATKAGFELLAEIVYDDYKDENGEVVFKIESTKTVKLMGKRIE